MAKNDFVEYVAHDLLGELGVAYRAMFGGYGLYIDGTIFAIIANNELYFKVDDTNRERYEEWGSSPFVYEAKGKAMSMSYWKLPPDIMDDSERLEEWVEDSLSISRKTKKPKKKTKKKSTRSKKK